jgi:hypothetical protein
MSARTHTCMHMLHTHTYIYNKRQTGDRLWKGMSLQSCNTDKPVAWKVISALQSLLVMKADILNFMIGCNRLQSWGALQCGQIDGGCVRGVWLLKSCETRTSALSMDLNGYHPCINNVVLLTWVNNARKANIPAYSCQTTYSFLGSLVATWSHMDKYQAKHTWFPCHWTANIFLSSVIRQLWLQWI